MLKYFRQVNARLEGVKELCDRNIQDEAKILEVGCGVGILTKHLQTRAKQVVSIDISEKGIDIAQAYAGQSNTDFFVLNLLENSAPLEAYGLFDAIVLADVIEHIPKDDYKNLFQLFERLLLPEGVLLMTFPNSKHQQFLEQNEPEKLQIIDLEVSVREILVHSTLHLLSMNYFDADGMNKYIHLVLSGKIPFERNRLTTLQKMVRRIQNIFWHARNRQFIQYVSKNLLK
jgi:2-polyprenyl-3-methyl-5-hydroxy-6-metoxy-1,4-benzoquinol methylase